MKKNKKQTTNSRTDSDKTGTLDAVQQWQIEHIKISIKQADAGQFLSHEEVKKMAAKWGRHV